MHYWGEEVKYDFNREIYLMLEKIYAHLEQIKF